MKVGSDPVLAKSANRKSDGLAHAHAQRRSQDLEFSMRPRVNPHTRTLHAIMLAETHTNGYRKLVDAAPAHVESVRSAIFDALAPDQAADLGHLVEIILNHIQPTGPWPDQQATPQRNRRR